MTSVGIGRPVVLTPGMALDRRVLTEGFLHAAALVASVGKDSIANDQFTRVDFKEWCWEEMFFTYVHDVGNIISDGGMYPNSVINQHIPTIDTFATAMVTWSASVVPVDDNRWTVGWPVVNGRAVYEGQDVKMLFSAHNDHSSVHLYDYSIGGTCRTLLTGGSANCGVVFMTSGRIKINSACVTVRSHNR